MSTKVFVYWNLHKKCWSVRDTKTRKVIHHSDTLKLVSCSFKVSEAGRQRVLRESRKNVHAGVEGYIAADNLPPPLTTISVRYNPYEMDSFTCNGKPIYKANAVWMSADKKVTIEPTLTEK